MQNIDNIHEQVRNFSRVMDTFMIEIRKMGTEMKNVFSEFIGTLDTAKERFSELEDQISRNYKNKIEYK